jgi:hypothetical protein
MATWLLTRRRDARDDLVGRALSALFALFMLGASIAPKLLGMPVAAETIDALGWSPRYVLMIGPVRTEPSRCST